VEHSCRGRREGASGSPGALFLRAKRGLERAPQRRTNGVEDGADVSADQRESDNGDDRDQGYDQAILDQGLAGLFAAPVDETVNELVDERQVFTPRYWCPPAADHTQESSNFRLPANPHSPPVR